MTYIFNKESYSLKEKATMAKPILPEGAQVDSLLHKSWSQEKLDYFDYVTRLKVFPCSNGNWIDKKEYSVDEFEVIWDWNHTTGNVFTPCNIARLKPNTESQEEEENNIWMEVKAYILEAWKPETKFKESVAIWAELKSKYSVTRKQQ